jgi:polyferredoxin
MDRLGGGAWGGVVVPLGLAYVGFVVMLFVYARSDKGARKWRGRPPTWSALLRHLLATAVAGYIVFLVVVLLFSFMFADPAQGIRQGFTEGGVIASISLFGLAFFDWVVARVRGGRGKPSSRGISSEPTRGAGLGSPRPGTRG